MVNRGLEFHHERKPYKRLSDIITHLLVRLNYQVMSKILVGWPIWLRPTLIINIGVGIGEKFFESIK